MGINPNLITRGRAHVGALSIGADGATVAGVKTGTLSVNPPSIAAGATTDVDVTLTGLAAGDILVLQPPTTFEADLVVSHWEVAANTVTIRLHNPTAGAIDGAARSWYYLWHDLT